MEIEESIRNVLVRLGVDLKNENFRDTPHRIAKVLREYGRRPDETEINKILLKSFKCRYDELITISGETYSLCPHHFLPVSLRYYFGYLPNGEVLGLSKIHRYIRLLARQPILQEELTTNIAIFFHSKLQPIATGVIIEGKHLCMEMRGVEQRNSVVKTSCLLGEFRTKPALREELLTLVRGLERKE